MENEDWTKKIQDKLIPFPDESGRKLPCLATEDVENLLAEREVLRRALKYYSREGDFSYAPDVAQKALEWKPKS